MQIAVTGRHVKVTDAFKDYAHQKAEKLLRFYDRVQGIEVILDVEGDQFSCEMLVSAGARNDFVAREIGDDVMALIDATEEKVERQLRKHKEKFRNRMHVNRKPPAP